MITLILIILWTGSIVWAVGFGAIATLKQYGGKEHLDEIISEYLQLKADAEGITVEELLSRERVKNVK